MTVIESLICESSSVIRFGDIAVFIVEHKYLRVRLACGSLIIELDKLAVIECEPCIIAAERLIIKLFSPFAAVSSPQLIVLMTCTAAVRNKCLVNAVTGLVRKSVSMKLFIGIVAFGSGKHECLVFDSRLCGFNSLSFGGNSLGRCCFGYL